MCSKTFIVKKSPVITKLWLKLVWCMFKIVEQWCAQAQFMFEECIHSLMVCYKWQYIYKEPRHDKLMVASVHWTDLDDSAVYWAAVIDDEQMNKKIDEQWRGWAAEVNKLRLTRDSWAAVSKWTRSWWAADRQQQRWAVLDNLAVLKSRCVAAVLISSIDQQQIEETSDEVM